MNVQGARAALEAAFDHPNADGDVCRKARDELLALEQEVALLRAQVEALGLEIQKARKEALDEAVRAIDAAFERDLDVTPQEVIRRLMS